jgi:DNA mismatch repair protein MutL
MFIHLSIYFVNGTPAASHHTHKNKKKDTMVHHHIERLSQAVINRIAAGEVVQRPSAALKEMLENSIDAGATRIQILCQDGGLGVLQIVDDGCGIYKEDLPLLCERFATSKLREFEDLSNVSSFGFRGEALASISHVSRVTVVTMRHDATHAWMSKFAEGQLVAGPSVHAGNPGTSIRVEDMFYNAPVRKSSLGKPIEEYARVLSVVQRYSMCFPHIAFSCRNATDGKWNGSTGSTKADFATQSGSTMLFNIKATFGSSLASHLIRLERQLPPVEKDNDKAPCELSDGGKPAAVVQPVISGFISDPTLANKKATLILFVNDRLVDSTAVRRCLEQVYASVLTSGQKFFVILSVTLPAWRVDVNVHPTKHEVMMLDEDILLRTIADAVREELAKSSTSKQLHVGEVDHRVLNLKPVSSSSTNVSTGGHRGVVVAPCTMTRVTEQRGDMMKYAVKVDRFDLVSKDTACDTGSGGGASLAEGHDTGALSTCGISSDGTQPLANGSASAGTLRTTSLSPQPVIQTATVSDVDEHSSHSIARSCEGMRDVPPAQEHVTVVFDLPPATVACSVASIGAPVVGPTLTSAATAVPTTNAVVSMSVPTMILEDDEESVDDDVQREFKRRRVDRAAVSSAAAAAPTASSTENRAGDHAADASCHCCPTTGTTAEVSPLQHEVSSSQQGVPQTEEPPLSVAPQPAAVVTALTSVMSMREGFSAQSPDDMRQLLSKMVLVGIVDPSLCLVQSGTSLFAVRTTKLAKDVARQKLCFSFGHHAQVTFVDGTAPSVRALLRYAADHCISPEKRKLLAAMSPNGLIDAVEQAYKTLRRWRRMLEEYFCIELTSGPSGGKRARRAPLSPSSQPSSSSSTSQPDLLLTKLPLVLGDAWPISHCRVPLMMWRLAHDVNFDTEEQCFAEISTIIAEELFGSGIEVLDANAEKQRVASGRSSTQYDAVRFGLLPVATGGRYYFPGMDLFTNHIIRSVVTVEALYKVFERC